MMMFESELEKRINDELEKQSNKLIHGFMKCLESLKYFFMNDMLTISDFDLFHEEYERIMLQD